MSKNSSKQMYSQLIEWLKGRGVDLKRSSVKKTKFNRTKR